MQTFVYQPVLITLSYIFCLIFISMQKYFERSIELLYSYFIYEKGFLLLLLSLFLLLLLSVQN